MNTKKENSSTKTKKTSKLNVSKSEHFISCIRIIIIIEMTLLAKKILGRTNALHLFYDVSKI